jgi:hypothetical protein
MTIDRRRAIIDRLAKYLVFQDDVTLLQGIYPQLRVELGQFVTQELQNGNVRYAADVGCHDDLVMSLAITLWVLVEDFENVSPSPAIVEDVIWKPGTMDLSKIYEERDRRIAEIEESQHQAMGLLQFNSEMIYYPRGYRG